MVLPSGLSNGAYCVSKFSTSVGTNAVFIAWDRATLSMNAHLLAFWSQTGHGLHEPHVNPPERSIHSEPGPALISWDQSALFKAKIGLPRTISILCVVPSAEFVATD